MSEVPLVGVWVYDREDAERLRVAAVIAQDRLAEPDLEVVIVSARADHVTVQLLRGELLDPTEGVGLPTRVFKSDNVLAVSPGMLGLLVQAFAFRAPNDKLPPGAYIHPAPGLYDAASRRVDDFWNRLGANVNAGD